MNKVKDAIGGIVKNNKKLNAVHSIAFSDCCGIFKLLMIILWMQGINKYRTRDKRKLTKM